MIHTYVEVAPEISKNLLICTNLGSVLCVYTLRSRYLPLLPTIYEVIWGGGTA